MLLRFSFLMRWGEVSNSNFTKNYRLLFLFCKSFQHAQSEKCFMRRISLNISIRAKIISGWGFRCCKGKLLVGGNSSRWEKRVCLIRRESTNRVWGKLLLHLNIFRKLAARIYKRHETFIQFSFKGIFGKLFLRRRRENP